MCKEYSGELNARVFSDLALTDFRSIFSIVGPMFLVFTSSAGNGVI